MAATTETVLSDWWRELRNDASAKQIARFLGAVDFASCTGALNAAESDGWRARVHRCPGHDDEGGRDWCAYGCELPRRESA